MITKVSAAIAGAFVAGVFVAAAPSALGHGPSANADRFDHHAGWQAGAMAGGCDEDVMDEHRPDMAEHMQGSGTDHMLGLDRDWMSGMMSWPGGGR